MKHMKTIIIMSFAVAIVSCSGNQALRKIDVTKFDAVYRAAKATEAAANVGVNYQEFGKLVQNLATEVSIAKDRASTPDESNLVSMYAGVLDSYKDSLAIWKAKIDLAGKDFPFKGAIPCVGEIATIASKYELPPIEWPAGGIPLIPDECLQYLWVSASDRLNAANSLYSGKPKAALDIEAKQTTRAAVYFGLKGQVEAAKNQIEENKRANAQAAENARLRKIKEAEDARLAPIRKAEEEKHLRETEDQRLDPEMEVFYVPGESLYHFRVFCPFVGANFRGITLREARQKFQRCPACESPRPKN